VDPAGRARRSGTAIAIGLADPRTRDLVDAGLVGALDGDQGREAILWFLALGLAFAALGELARWAVRRAASSSAKHAAQTSR
jgi:hypothetical protein